MTAMSAIPLVLCCSIVSLSKYCGTEPDRSRESMRHENQPWLHSVGAAVTTSVLLSVLAAACAPGAGPQAAKSADPPLRRVADIPMPGPAVRFDYQSLDEEHGRLYIAHM